MPPLISSGEAIIAAGDRFDINFDINSHLTHADEGDTVPQAKLHIPNNH